MGCDAISSSYVTSATALNEAERCPESFLVQPIVLRDELPLRDSGPGGLTRPGRPPSATAAPAACLFRRRGAAGFPSRRGLGFANAAWARRHGLLGEGHLEGR